MGPQGDQAAPKASNFLPDDAQSLPKPAQSHPKTPKVVQSGPNMAPKVRKKYYKSEKSGARSQNDFGNDVLIANHDCRADVVSLYLQKT